MINLGNIEIADLRLGASQVKALYLGNEQVWSGEEPVPPTPTNDWLCFTAEEANSTVAMAKGGWQGAPSVSLECSTDGNTWSPFVVGTTTVTLANIGDKVYIRATSAGNTEMGNSSSSYNKFVMTGKIAASGNIQTLLKDDGSKTDVSEFCYYRMFADCTLLTTAPKLPATTLAERCYQDIFNGCTSLTTVPNLPATALVSNCYNGMFSGCTSLTTAPALPATTLASNCYQNMFRNCSALTTAPKLPATTLASSCYAYMFYGCTSLNSIEVAFTAWNPTNATSGWLQNVAASGTFTCPSTLPDTRGISNIPEGWTKVDAT